MSHLIHDVENACRRFLDYAGSRDQGRESLEKDGLRASPAGRLKALREGALATGAHGIRGGAPGCYGPFEKYSKFRLAGFWKQLLKELDEKHLLVPRSDGTGS